MDVEKLVQTKAYKEARLTINGLKSRLEKAAPSELYQIIQDKDAFFSGLSRKDPEMYEAFRIEDKLMAEEVHKKVFGKEVTMD